MVRKWSEPVDPTSSLLFQVPGGSGDPSGVLVCADDRVAYHHSNQDSLSVPIPRRRGVAQDPERKRTIVFGVMHKLKNSAEAFFFLLQTEEGDLFKVTLRICIRVTCLALGEVPEGRLRSSFLAVGCDDCTVRILSLEPESTLESMSDSSLGGPKTVYLHIGLDSGVYLPTVLDEITGSLTDTERKFLGIKTVKLFQVSVKQRTCVLALSSKPWGGYVDPFEEGIIGVHGNSLRIFSVEDLRENVVQKLIPLKYTPRHLVKHPDQPYFYTIESDNNTLDPELCAGLAAAVIDPAGKQVLQRIHLTDNEAATSLAIISFASHSNELFLIVGTAQNLTLNRAGLGTSPHLFDPGLKQLLRKTAAQSISPALIVSLHPLSPHRLAVADAQHGVSVVSYHPDTSTLHPWADDTIPRWTTALTALDASTVAGGDKFGNLWVLRCPEPTSNPVEGQGRAYLRGAPHRMTLLAHFFTGDIPTRITKTHFGTVGVLVPFEVREEAEVFGRLEVLMREVDFGGRLVGREHGAYRGYYVLVKGFVDGDLCEGFGGLGSGVREVERVVKSMRARYAF
ncbi:Pre-mRNA-splicing factor rse1 [Staphylotrichum tortipilum]|uniref:Pre-mRNA-splicing factor rse1 n=1 Tax=Staphylotrichum tortipilum TaxID=2831512 RepID=A0AAN6MFD0_9PEZI|nr:Pre-mRNA-splicing factor rse1 [Staphylotrichum longicolle]